MEDTNRIKVFLAEKNALTNSALTHSTPYLNSLLKYHIC